MAYIQLTEPFEIVVEFEGVNYEVQVTYVKSKSCENFFDVCIKRPRGLRPFSLKEDPIRTPEFEYVLWADENGKQNSLYQEIGNAIAKYLRKHLGIYLIDIPITHDEEDFSQGHNR